MRHASLLVLALIVAVPAAAQVYQWRDAEGRLHYSDVPPPQGEAITVRPARKATAPAEPAGTPAAEGAKPAAEAAKPKTLADKELEFRQRRAAAAEAQAKAEQERALAAERQRACEQARNQLAALKTGQRMVRYTSTGEREFIDGAGRAAEIEQTQKYADSVCK